MVIQYCGVIMRLLESRILESEDTMNSFFEDSWSIQALVILTTVITDSVIVS